MAHTSADEVLGAAAVVENEAAHGSYVILCDHASNRFPAEFGTRGLDARERQRHIAWDPGALPVARMLSERLDAPLVRSTVSRLILDCNRGPEAPDLIPTISELTTIPGNAGLGDDERTRRIALVHGPFHEAIDDLIGRRLKRGIPTAVVSVHSFTPVYKGVSRPWQIGILFDRQRRLADEMIDALRQDPTLSVGVNQPYSPADRVYYTLGRHADERGLPSAMIEIRNDEIAEASGQMAWADRLGTILERIGADRGVSRAGAM
jgi:predicted N-formylglutamate amidohydrolase